MSKDTLFLLAPGFEDNGRREFCPECAELWGVLSYYPAIKEALDIHYVGIEHPRAPICVVLGEGRWNAPTLVLGDTVDTSDLSGVRVDRGKSHLGSARNIAKYFAQKYGTPMPRGS
ncbi:MAG: DUF3088 family protein [Pseudomonadota bacterium]